MKPDRVLDCTGLFCPEPVFITRLVLDKMNPGEVLEVMADDPAATEDFTRLVKRLGHVLISIETIENETKILIQKA